MSRIDATYRRPFMPVSRRVPGSSAVRLRYKSMGGDHIVCREWDGTIEGSVDVLVAKPWLLRRTTAARSGYSLAYTNDYTRASTKQSDGSSETQTIVPSFAANDEIWAVTGETGMNVDGQAVEYIDLNLDGRAWAKTV